MTHPLIRDAAGPALVPKPGVAWSDTMILNPAIVRDPASQRIHMLFRATGACRSSYSFGQRDPYPIFLGYAWSDDLGQTWEADFSRPALAPRLAVTPETILFKNHAGKEVVDFSNGCIEDPRLIPLEGKLYLTVACRMFPPGPYWEHDEPLQCTPPWALDADLPFGRAARENLTVNVLFEVHLDKLIARQYEQAFTYLGPMTDPQRGDNRDAFLFPERLKINGKLMYVCAHRPREAWNYPEGKPGQSPTMYLAAAETLEDMATDRALHVQLAQGVLPWEGNRVGGSFPPIRIAPRQWLMPYHGKQNDEVGYTQSFMILEEDEAGWPRVKHRCSDRLLYASQSWQRSERFTIPCIFTCGGVVTDDGDLVMSYGAADEIVGIARTNLASLVQHVRTFDAMGRPLPASTLAK